MAIQESGEMYLETILLLSKEKENIRAIDICQKMDFSKPSVSRALGLLKEDKLISVSNEGYISLSESGKMIAEKIYERHVLITEMLTSFGVDKSTAQVDACRIEHVISDETLKCIKKFLEKR